MLRLVLAGAIIALIAAGCGGGDSPTSTVAQNGSSGSEATTVPTSTVAQNGSSGSEATTVPTSTVAQNGSGGSEATAVPTSTVAQNGRSGSDLTEAEIAAYCGETSDWLDSVNEDEMETFGEAAQRLDRLFPVLEDVTPPDELKGYHSALVAVYKYFYDSYRSGDANTPLEEAADHPDPEAVAVLSDLINATEALGRETASQLRDAGCQ